MYLQIVNGDLVKYLIIFFLYINNITFAVKFLKLCEVKMKQNDKIFVAHFLIN
jgi:hypothetical protein